MNKKFAICSALLVLGSMTVLAQDSKPGIIHINGGAPKANRLCQGTVKNMPSFSDTNTQVVSFNCAAI